MSIQRLHAFEKTSIQARHTIKRLEILSDNPRSTEQERQVAGALLENFKEIRRIIPNEFQDVDIEKG